MRLERLLAERLRERHLTLRALARAAGVSHSALSRAMRGLSRPTPALLAAVAGPLGCTIEELWRAAERRTDGAPAGDAGAPNPVPPPSGGPRPGAGGPSPATDRSRPSGDDPPPSGDRPRPPAADPPPPDAVRHAPTRVGRPSGGATGRRGRGGPTRADPWAALRALGVDPAVDAARVRAQLGRLREYAATAEARQLAAEGLARKIAALGARGPVIERLRSLGRTYLEDEDAPAEVRAAAGSAVLYFLLAVDDIDDYIFPVGYLDDAVAVRIADAQVRRLRARGAPDGAAGGRTQPRTDGPTRLRPHGRPPTRSQPRPPG